MKQIERKCEREYETENEIDRERLRETEKDSEREREEVKTFSAHPSRTIPRQSSLRMHTVRWQ